MDRAGGRTGVPDILDYEATTSALRLVAGGKRVDVAKDRLLRELCHT